jgi:DNA modification methylase
MTTQIKWTTVQKTSNQLTPHKENPRKISKEQLEALKKSLEKFGLAEIPAINLNETILAGHQRIKVLQLLGRGEELIDVRIPNRQLTEQEAKEYLVGSNALGGDWDLDLLTSFDTELLLDCGFEDIELTKIFNEEKKVEEDNINIEKELQKITTPVTQLGDIIELGNHRIICGDSTKNETLSKLFGDSKASMIYSDPVYNININYSGGIGGKSEYGGTVNDNRSETEYYKFIEDSITAGLTVTNKDAHVFYWCDQVYIGYIQDIYRKRGIENKRVCLWIKNNQNPVPSVAFNKVYEPCVYGILGKPYLSSDQTKHNEVLNQEMTTGNQLLEDIDIWLAKRLSGKEYEHATSKPITLHEGAIKRCSKIGDIILDSFLGSGSTLLCAEQLGRAVYGCELEPVFCDLIVKRWEKLTGRKAIYLYGKKE